MADVSFNQLTLEGYSGAVSALQWGPDGRLYVSERFGDVKILTVEKSDGAYTVTAIETIDLVKSLPNHNDDGALAASVTGRQVTGIVVGGTADDPVIYVSSSDPRIGAGGGGQDKNLDTNSGIISRLTVNDATGEWEKVDIVRGLPRSEENHATNGMELSADGNTLYVAQGGHANAGAPSNNFAGQPEYAYSAAILSVDLAAIDALPVIQDAGGHDYVYDLPTLDDPDRPNDGTAGNENADGSDVSGPFGGNDGFNMAKIEADSPVQVYSPGYRNPYDVLLTQDGQLYTYDNGANNGWGGRPVDANGDIVTDASQTATNKPNEDNPYNPKNYDNLHLVTEGSYGGHPNPIRASGEDAGLLVSPSNGVNGSTWLAPGDAGLPADFSTVVDQTNPQEGVYQEGGFDDTALDTGQGSVNGLAEYTASVTWDDGNGGQTSIQGALLATDYNGDVYIIPRENGAVETTTGNAGQTVAEGKQVVSLGGGGPLGIDAVGDGEPFAGTIWVGKLNNGSITILEPGSGSSADTDLDDDGLDNVVDPFALDADNGTGASDVISGGETREYTFESGSIQGTFGGAGFTGAMINGTDAFQDGGLYDADNIIAGGAGGVVTFKQVAEGDTYQGENAGRDNLQFGVTLDETVGTAAITLNMNNWLPDATSSGGFPSAGLQIGAGDQDNYIKLVLGGRGSNNGDYTDSIFEFGVESGGSASNTSYADTALLDAANATWVQLRVLVDPEAGTVTPQWRYGTGVAPNVEADTPAFTSGNAVALADGSALLNAIRGDHTVDGQASGLAVGLIATSNNGTPFQADFDDITIQTTQKAATPASNQSEVDAAGTDGYDRVAYSGTQDVVLPDDVEEIDLSGNNNDVNVTGSAGANVIVAGTGVNQLAGGGGADTFRGTGAALDGDTITDFDADDVIEVTGVDANASLVGVANGSAILNLDTTGDGNADSALTLTGSNFEGANDAGDFDVTVDNGTMSIAYAPGPGPVVAAINAGTGGALTQTVDGEPIQFSADQHFSGGSTFTDNNGGNGQQPVYDGTVYETERYGNFSYAIPNLDPSKEYVVTLLFAEIYTDDPGTRIMDVAIEGTIPAELDDLDIVAATGDADTPFTYTSEPVAVGANGTLDIVFTTIADNAKISGIVVREADGTPPADTDGPSVASIAVTPPAAGDADATVTVVYEDPSGVSVTSIDAGDIAVTGAGTPGTVTVQSSSASNGGETLTVTYAVSAPAGGWTDGAYQVEVVAGEVADEAAGANTNDAATQNFSVQTTTPDTELVVAINAGGPQYTRGDGVVFEADTAGDPHPFYVADQDDNKAYSDLNDPISGTDDDTIYQYERYGQASASQTDADDGSFSYAIKASGGADLPSGSYVVTLHFAEIFDQPSQASGADGPGDRQFNVQIGSETITNYDIWAEAGGGSTAVTLTRTVEVSDGTLVIDFSQGAIENPKVNAIEVHRILDGDDPTDDVALGVNVGDFSDDPNAPSEIDLSLGSNVITATQEGDPRDYDYITFTVAEGQVLSAINVDGFDDYDDTMTNAVFLGIQEGATFTEGPENPDPANLLGGVTFGENEVGTDILDDMADGEVQGQSTIGFEQPLGPGTYTLWFSQNQMATTATLDFVVAEAPKVGAVRLGITESSNNVQTSNFGANSFVLENVGEKVVASVAIDVSTALFPDAVFDPFGVAGDTIAKELTINTTGGTGVIAPTSETASDFSSTTATYIGAGGSDGFEGIVLRFDEGTDGGFQTGESVGFQVDMDPNSIAGAEKGTLDSGADPAWDIGGISGAELIGSTFTVTFADGTTATGQIHGANNQAGAKGLASQDAPGLAVDLSAGGAAPGGTGTYGSDAPPPVIVEGPAGETARVVMVMGMIQPQENNFSGSYKDQLDAQLAELAASNFPANNAAEFQTVDVVLTGEPQDITAMFDFSNVDNYDVPGEGALPLGFAAAVIDPSNDDLPLGPVTAPVYLTHDGVFPPEPGAYLPNENGDIVFEVEDAGEADQDGWVYQTEHDQGGHEPYTGSGFYTWEGGDKFGTPGNGVLSYEFTPDTSGVYYVNIRGSRVVTSTDTTEQNDVFARIRLGEDALDARDGYRFGTPREPDYTGDPAEGWLKVYQSGGQTGQWIWANKNIDNVGVAVAYELEAGQTYTFELSGRSEGFEMDRVHLAYIENPPDPSSQTTLPVQPDENAPLSPRTPTQDLEAPTAVLEEPADIVTTAPSQTVTVVYDDDVDLDETTIDAGDVTLLGPDGVTVYAASGVATTAQPDGSVRADYTFDAPQDGFPLGEYTVQLADGAVADAAGKPTAAATDTFTVGEPTLDAEARVGVTLGAGDINVSTFGANSFAIANTSGSGQTITSVTFDLGGSILPDMVFDPNGNAGDQLGKGFSADSGAAAVGLLTANGATGSPPFGTMVGNNGYETLTLDFSNFEVGESFGFSVDIDPASIEGAQTTGFAGSVSGLELSGATVTVTFSDGSTHTGALFADNENGGEPSNGGSETVVRAGLLAAPTLSVLGAALMADAQAEAAVASVAETQQTVQIDGGAALAGQTVRVVVVQAKVGTDGLADPQDAFGDLGTYGANQVTGVASYDVVLDAGGQGSVAVTLVEPTGDDDGRNVIQAAVVDGNGEVAGLVSSPVSLRVDPGSDTTFDNPFVEYDVSPADGGGTLVTDVEPANGTEAPREFDPSVDTLLFADGVEVSLTYSGSVLTDWLATDADNNSPWSTIAASFDGDGFLTDKAYVYDNGDLLDQTFDAGVIASHVFQDVSNTRTFDTITRLYTQGELSELTYLYDDEDVFSQFYADGRITATRFEDGSGARPWSSVDKTFNSDGNLQQRVFTYDDGDVLTQTFSGGKLVENALEDGSDARPWDTMTATFGADGTVDSRSFVYDNGDELDLTYVDGKLREYLYEDVPGEPERPWQFSQRIYDESGALVEHNFVYDNSDRLSQDYVDGVLRERFYEDISDTREWFTLTATFDENGDLIDRTYVYDSEVA